MLWLEPIETGTTSMSVWPRTNDNCRNWQGSVEPVVDGTLIVPENVFDNKHLARRNRRQRRLPDRKLDLKRPSRVIVDIANQDGV
jgi:hypothetical protein